MTQVIGANFSATYTQAEITASGVGFAAGDLSGMTHDGKQYQFVSAAAAITAGDTVFFTGTYAVQALTTALGVRGARVAVANVAIASGSFGWVQVYGVASARSAGAVAANARINTTTTAGAVDDDAGAGSIAIEGMSNTASNASATTLPVMLTHPTLAHIVT